MAGPSLRYGSHPIFERGIKLNPCFCKQKHATRPQNSTFDIPCSIFDIHRARRVALSAAKPVAMNGSLRLRTLRGG